VFPSVKLHRKEWLKTQDPDQQGAGSDVSITPTPSCVGSLPPRSPPMIEGEHEEATHSEEEEVKHEEASGELGPKNLEFTQESMIWLGRHLEV
ncbi:hypothetical protein GCK32_020538, partial [Trichostrongylus colubriformis]